MIVSARVTTFTFPNTSAARSAARDQHSMHRYCCQQSSPVIMWSEALVYSKEFHNLEVVFINMAVDK